MMVGELVLPEVIVGITEASTTRNPATPLTRNCAVHHRQRIVGPPHAAGADRMEDGGADVAGGARQLFLAVGTVGPA